MALPKLSAELSALHQREVHQVRGLDHDQNLRYKRYVSLGFSESRSVGHPGLKIAQLINHHKMKTNCEISQTQFVFKTLA